MTLTFSFSMIQLMSQVSWQLEDKHLQLRDQLSNLLMRRNLSLRSTMRVNVALMMRTIKKMKRVRVRRLIKKG